MNRRSNLVFHARLAGVVLLIECVTFWGWSKWFWTPVQAQYMGAYVWSSLPRKAPDSALKIRWIWKTAPGGKRQLAIEDDAVRVPSSEHNRTGMDLSQMASEAGWTGLLEGPPEAILATRLRAILTDQIFEGQSVWLFVLLPGMIGFACAIFILQCLISLEGWLPEMPWRQERFPWEQGVPTLFDQLAIGVKRIRSRITCLHRAATQKTRTHPSVSTMAVPVKQAAGNPRSLASPIFGVQGGSNARVYVWSEGDEID